MPSIDANDADIFDETRCSDHGSTVEEIARRRRRYVHATLYDDLRNAAEIYDRLPDDNPIVYRLTLDDGERLIGRVISETQRAGTLARLGVEMKADPHGRIAS